MINDSLLVNSFIHEIKDIRRALLAVSKMFAGVKCYNVYPHVPTSEIYFLTSTYILLSFPLEFPVLKIDALYLKLVKISKKCTYTLLKARSIN